MAERYTRKDAEDAFRQFAEVLGKSTEPYTAGPVRKANIGAWLLDYNATYGGCRIEEITNEAGAVRNPFVSQRLRPREFCMAVAAALAALAIAKGSR